MPEATEGSPVGTADMHGSTIQIDITGQGKVTFELVRVGTVKEFDTVKEALAHRERAAEESAKKTNKLREQLASMEAKLEQASSAYSTEKEVSTELTKANQGLAEGIQRQKDTIAKLTKELDAAIGEKDALSTSCDNFTRELLSVRAELEDLMTVKASLEETNTALEVKDKELCEAREESAAAKVAFGELDATRIALTGERDASRQALADLKAELLAACEEGGGIFNGMIEKLSGE